MHAAKTRTEDFETSALQASKLHDNTQHSDDATHTATMSAAAQSVQCFGKKKTATAVAHCKQGKGLIKVNGKPLSLVEPQVLRFKVYEPILLLGLDKFGTYLCVTGGVEDGERELFAEREWGLDMPF
jgi:hypothetical protein